MGGNPNHGATEPPSYGGPAGGIVGAQYAPNPQNAPSTQLADPGAWTLVNGQWSWSPDATPNPGLVSEWGPSSLTNPETTPNGGPGAGAWTNSGRGAWQWVWGATPDPGLVNTYGTGALTNPDQTPSGSSNEFNLPGDPPPPDVVPPTIADSWGGQAPSVTGILPSDSSPTTTTQNVGHLPVVPPVSQPPTIPAFQVSTGGIENAENTLLRQIDTQITNYDNLKSYVAQSASQNLASAGDPGMNQGNMTGTEVSGGVTMQYLTDVQDNLLQGVADAIQTAGQLTSMLNVAAQTYAMADKASFLPTS
jgi:hypothetical protein